MLRGLISGCSAGCGHDGPPLFNGMTLLGTDIMDDDYITNTRGVLAAYAALWRNRTGGKDGCRCLQG